MPGQAFVDDGTGKQLRLKGTDQGDGTASIDVTGLGATPAAAPITDTDPNPTTSSIASRLTGWTGSVWERLKSIGGALFVAEQFAPLYEDAANSVASTGEKPVVDPSYSTSTLLIPTANTAGEVVKGSACLLTGFVIENRAVTARYAHIFNSATAPAPGAVPDVTIPISPGSSLLVGDPMAKVGRYYSNGVYLAVSTSFATLVLGTPAEHDMTAWGV